MWYLMGCLMGYSMWFPMGDIPWNIAWGIACYPVALRAISATVPTAFFVLACQSSPRKGTHKTKKTTKNRHPKLSKNRPKSTPGGVLEALGGGFGTILAPGGAPEGSQGRPEPKKWRKVRPFFVASLFFGHPKITHFRYFFDFCGVCLGIFFGSGFGRPPGTIFGGFWSDFRHVFSCSFEDVGRGSVLRKTSFRIVIYSVFGTSTFSKKVEKWKKYV